MDEVDMQHVCLPWSYRLTSSCFFFFLTLRSVAQEAPSIWDNRKGRCGGETGLREAGEVFAAGLEANFCQKMCFSFLTCSWSMATPVKSTLAVWTASHCLYYPGTPYIFSGMALKNVASLCRSEKFYISSKISNWKSVQSAGSYNLVACSKMSLSLCSITANLNAFGKSMTFPLVLSLQR